jgi:hypothetical protein
MGMAHVELSAPNACEKFFEESESDCRNVMLLLALHVKIYDNLQSCKASTEKQFGGH